MAEPVVDDFEIFEESTLEEELAQIPAGPELAARLASIDRAGLNADGVLAVADARQRLIAHQQAQLLADVHAVARKVPKGGPLPNSVRQYGPYQWAEVECAYALRWTQVRAAGQMVMADEVIDRLPQVFAALDAGRIDMPKACVISDLLGSVHDAELASALADKVIDKAQEWTTAKLRAQLRRLVLAAEPDRAAQKAKEGIAARRVVAYPDGDSGLASLAGYELAPHRVAAVMERLDAAAKAAKAAGDQRSANQLRADLFLDLLCGEGIAAGGPISDGSLGLAPTADPEPEAEAVPWPDQPAPAAEPDTEIEDEGGAEGGVEPEPVPPPDPEQLVDLWAFGIPDPPHPADLAGSRDGSDGDDSVERRRWTADFDRLAPDKPATRCILCGHQDRPPATAAAMPALRRGVVEITCSLTTLMGLSELPAELNGYGPVAADVARQIVAQLDDAQWRFSAYDYLDGLAHHGITHTRPTLPGEHQTTRRPGAALTAFIKARDRMCVAPGCRRTARRCQIDHNLDWVNGGETVHCNLGMLCGLHHAYKHATGCELVQLSPGVFVWTTPIGRQYLTRAGPPLLDENHLAGLPKSA